MPLTDVAIPILPSRSLPESVAFYRRLGFDGGVHPHGNYAILTRGPVELHFFPHHTLRPAESAAMCYLRVSDVDAWFRTAEAAGLPRSGLPRLDPVENKPWGLREFAVVDPDGNLLRIGQVLAA